MNKHDNGNHKKLNGEVVQQYRFFNGNQGRESFTQDGSHLYKIASIRPTVSLISSDSCVSSCSDISVDANSVGRYDQEEGSLDGSQEDLNFSSSGSLQNLGSSIYANGIHRSITEEFKREILGTGVGQRLRDNVVNKTGFTGLSIDDEPENSHSCHENMDTQFWLPPEPEDQGDDIVGSVSNYDGDDDDECGNGMKWGKPSSVNGLGEEDSGSSRFKVEKQKTMDDVMNGKFKTLVGQLLKSVDVSLSREDGDSWVDIVTSLSWEAASFVKPDATESKAMNPDGYIKIKCVATGTCSQSQVVKGLVFKKHAALKRMPTKYEKPRLLLIQGELGVSSSGLSSFELVKQENDSLQSVIEMIEMCHPNVVLVEKSVSRDIQESILAKGMTLISDMKNHRLERIACCTGSKILSSDMLNGQKLRRCDSFRIEKFEEEHTALGEGGKKPRKTLIFLEGCPTRMGCTILLMGTHTDELKRIKCVVQCAVVMAYHLILETSFILDQRAMFSILPLNGMTNISLTSQETPVVSGILHDSSYEKSHAETNSSCEISTLISNGFHEEGSVYPNLAFKNDSLSYEPYNPIVFSGLSSLSASLKKVIGDSFPLFSSTSRQSMSTYFGLDEMDRNDNIQASSQVSSSLEAFDHSATETTEGSDQDKTFNFKPSHSSSNPYKDNPNIKKSSGSDDEQRQSKDDISTVLHSESILVLMSSRNASRGTICEHCHFSRIKFYQNFDVPLGKFLRDNLLNQRLQCNTCGEAPEAHFYYYAHHNKQLTIQVKSLPNEKHLPGESEGKLWMWSHCGKCRHLDENSKSTKRVLISTAARSLSFGKFLELSFSDQSSFCKPSRCGHSFNRDFLYFFGLGTMVALFRYSPVSTYSVSLPPQKLESSSSIKGEFLEKDFKNLYMKGIMMFEDVAKALKKIESQFMGSAISVQGSIKEFSDIENMLTQERHKFEVDIHNTIMSGKVDNAAYKFLSLNRLQWELLLESYVWDRRLHFLLSPDTTVCKVLNSEKSREDSTCLRMDGNAEDTDVEEIIVGGDMNNKSEASVEADDFLVREIQIEGSIHVSIEGHKALPSPDMSEDIAGSMPERINANESSTEDITMKPELSDPSNSIDEQCQPDPLPSVSQSQTGSIQPVSGNLGSGDIDLDVPQRGKSKISFSLSNLENCKEWIWTCFPEIQLEYMEDLRRGYIPKFECICRYTVDTMVHKLITEDGSRLYIPVGTNEYIVSDYDDEFSSIIACSLALLKDVPVTTERLDEDAKKEKVTDTKIYDPFRSFSRFPSLSSSYWSSIGSQDSDRVHLPHSISAEELHLSSFDGLNLLDSPVSSWAIHPEVSLSFGRSARKGKYSVVCLYANLFRDLRSRCCLSELYYIASLSRCRNWDAKGGKSKSFFAKTLDDRFIVKKIKRTEFDSVVKFALEYFRYMNQCFDMGNQTCLAKILGIYQIKLTKSGKEMKHYLMVMENLSFGRNISRQYDLKGALHARFNSAADSPGDVLLDQNFVNDMNASPLYFSRKGIQNLQRAVWNDTTFLNSINVMDYSLLVGVDTQQRELVCGIIDYLRKYTWDKQLENWVKSSLVVPKNQLPTVISPKEYKKRFRKFIHNHFLSVPDNWCS